jgi:hypothetical protein
MRRWTGVLAVVLVMVALIAVGNIAYHRGLDEGIVRGLEQAGSDVQVVRVSGRGFGGGYGFFPFGLLFFPLFLFLIFGLFRRAAWKGGHHHGPGGWQDRYEDWHRRQHEGGTGDPGPATA